MTEMTGLTTVKKAQMPSKACADASDKDDDPVPAKVKPCELFATFLCSLKTKTI
jgi:hypothetical protein